MGQGNQQVLTAQNPWPGLRAFTESDRDFFFGRKRETAELLELVEHSAAVVLYGQSGLGKTSLLQAGIFPELKKSDFLPVRVRFDHGEGAASLADQVKGELSAALDAVKSTAPKPSKNETLWEYFHRRDVDFWGPRNRLLTPVIVLDQFEEVFTLGQRDEESSARVRQFAAELEAVLEHRVPESVRKRLNANPDASSAYDLERRSVIFLISLREDFLPELDPWRARIPSLLARRFRLERMTGAQALEVVQCGGQDLLDSDAARAIVDFVSKSRHDKSARAMEQRDVEPALLSVVCDELNRRRIERGKAKITLDLLSDEREEIIKDFYERSFDGVSPRVRDWVEDRLLTASGYRNRAALEDAIKAGLPEADFNTLVNRRILHREEREGVVWVELTHDLLTDPALESRSERERKRVAEAAREREEQYAHDLRKSRTLVSVFGVLFVAAAIALIFAVHSKRVADRATAEAEKETKAANEARSAAENALKESAANYQTASGMAEQMSFRIGGSSWIPAATVLKDIDDANTAHENLSKRGAITPAQHEQHARFLTRAADALYQIGHFDEGVARSNEALQILTETFGAQPTSQEGRIREAEALYELGTGVVTQGKVREATESFNKALSLSDGVTDAAFQRDASRVKMLSEIGLGNASVLVLDYEAGKKHYGAALELSGRLRDDDETRAWKARALEGRGQCEFDLNEAKKWYAKAQEIVNELLAHDPSDTRWKALESDVNYRQGYASRQLNQYDEARKNLEKAAEDAEELCTRDCPTALDASGPVDLKNDKENWEWRLLLLQAWRGEADMHMDLKENAAAEALLTKAERAAKDLKAAQPDWTRTNLLYGIVLMDLGQVAGEKLTSTNSLPERASTQGSGGGQGASGSKGSKGSGDLQAQGGAKESAGGAPKLAAQMSAEDYAKIASNYYVEAGKVLGGSNRAAVDDLEFTRMYAATFWDQGDLAVSQADKLRDEANGKGPGVAKANEEYRAAIGYYEKALGVLQPIESKTKHSPDILRSKAQVYGSEAQVEDNLKEKDRALAAYKKSLESWKAVKDLQPTPGDYEGLAVAYYNVAEWYRNSDQKQAAENYEHALEAIKPAFKGPSSVRTRVLGRSATIHSRYADIRLASGDVQGALGDVKQGIEDLWEALQTDYADSWLLGKLDGLRNGELPKASLKTIGAALQDPTSVKIALKNPPNGERSKEMVAEIGKLDEQANPRNLLDLYGKNHSTSMPLINGPWHVVRDEKEREAVSKEAVALVKNVQGAQIEGIRELPLIFYQGASLYELDIHAKNGARGVIALVQNGKDPTVVNGKSDRLSNLNRTSGLELNTQDQATAYLRFWVGSIADPNQGRFRLIDRIEDIDWAPEATVEDRAGVADKIRPLLVEAGPNGDWQAIGCIDLGGGLYDASFSVSRSGNVQMSTDRTIKENLPVMVEEFKDEVRVQKPLEEMLKDSVAQNPKNKAAWIALISYYHDVKRWKETATAESRLIDAVLEHESDPDRYSDLQNAYFNLAVYQIYGHDYAGAVETGAKLKKLSPGDSDSDRIYAHALLLNGQTKEAEEVYLSRAGTRTATRPWTELIQGDFENFSDRGIKSQSPTDDYDHVIALMQVKEYEKRMADDPNDGSVLADLASAYFTLKRWDDAEAAQKKWVGFVRDSGKVDAKQLLGPAYTNLAWFDLFAKDFSGALAACEEGRKYSVNSLTLETNCAHALMFVGRTQEAEEIYMKHRGEKMRADRSATWDETIRGDFRDLRAAKVESPEMGKVLGELGEK
jgi:tetratricopeptide (TPR) repeat protein